SPRKSSVCRCMLISTRRRRTASSARSDGRWRGNFLSSRLTPCNAAKQSVRIDRMNWRDSNLRLRRLEAEAIFIIRETIAEFKNPVILYSVGKDSSVMLHIAQKAFQPSKPPFPLLHVDTTWKFREMITFRDEAAKRVGMDLLVHVNEGGLA